MKKAILFAITAVLASAILITAGVGASADYQQQQNPKTEIAAEKIYFAFYGEPLKTGAAAFCLDNRFTAVSDCEDSISLCSVDEEGNRTVLYKIPKENVRVWFSGETKRKTQLDPKITSLLGGLSGIGIVVDSEKTNVMILLRDQPIKRNTQYYIYIPEDYFIDENGNTNAGGYVELKPSDVKSVSGNIITDIMSLFDVDTSGLVKPDFYGTVGQEAKTAA
ncbi:MAG: hypothetical protein ACI4SB_03725 [Acutalibacteraceae bacterium]